MCKKKKKHFSPEEKVAAVRRHLLEQVPVSKICDELNITPTCFYSWQKILFSNGDSAFSKDSDREKMVLDKKVMSLQKSV